MKLNRRVLLISLAVLVFASLPAMAQQSALVGTVTDASGAVIPGATVTLTHKGTGATRTADTGADGGYNFPFLAPGKYRIEVSSTGFKTVVQENLTIAIGITSTFNASMEIGQMTESIIVEDDVAALNTVDASMGTPLTGDQILNLPSANLDPAGLLSLQPGVSFVPVAADTPGGYSGFSRFDGRGGAVNGARSDQTNITLDGVDVNDAENGFAFTSALRSTQVSLQEFRVTTNNYNADAGRSSGAQVQLVTKSGTNDIHGTAYYANRNEAFSANNFFNNRDGVEKGKLRRHIYGAAVGAPIVKDRAFFFVNYERLEHAEDASVLRNIPSESFKDGLLIYECAEIDPDGIPGTGDEFPDPLCVGTQNVPGISGTTYPVGDNFYGLTQTEFANIDPAGIGANPAVISYLQQFPLSNTAGNIDGLNIRGFRFNTPFDQEFNTLIFKTDFNLNQEGTHTVFLRGTFQDDTLVSAGAAFPGNISNQDLIGSSRGIAAGYTAVLSPEKVNNFRFGITRIGEEFAGIRDSEFVGLRFITELNGFDGTASSRDRFLTSTHIRDDFSWTRGNHTIGFGGEIRFTRNDRSSNASSFNTFTVNPSWLPNVGRQTQPGSADCFQSAAEPDSTTTGCDDVPAVAGSFASGWNDSAPNLLGIITQVDGNFNVAPGGGVLASGDPVARNMAVDEYEVYLQDQWRVNPELTVTYGIRYFVSSPPWETNGLQVVPTPNLTDWFEERRALMLAGRPTNAASDIGFDLGGPANNADDFYAWDKNNWSPRFAVAWAPQIDNAFFGNGKMVIRGGWSLVYDKLGNALASSFDRGGSFGMATNISSPFGGCDEGIPLTSSRSAANGPCPRFAGTLNTAIAAAMVPTAPSGTFPAVPPADRAISQALDSGIITPYAHVYNISLGRELANGFALDVSFVGRKGRNLLISRDLAMQADVVDPVSGQNWFDSSVDMIGRLEAGDLVTDIPNIQFWENMFPGWGAGGANGGELPCAGGTGFSASQVAFDLVNCMAPDTTFLAWVIDGTAPLSQGGWINPGHMTCSAADGGTNIDGDAFLDCPFAFFDDQFATLNAWSSIAKSEYNAGQISLRRSMDNGIGFTVNYAFSHSLDHSSTPERQGLTGFGSGGGGGTTINSWRLDQEYADSDFDMRHQLNSNFNIEMPFGHGKANGADIPGWADQILGGWQVSGIMRLNSGLPASIANGRVWPTNWNLSGNATCTGGPVADPTHSVVRGACAATQNVKDTVDGRGPNLFSDPLTALGFFRQTLPGERGIRNEMTADQFKNLDLSLAKTFTLPKEGHTLKFRWDIFNVTNSVYFDSVSLNASQRSAASFGNYTATMGNTRFMQVGLRYEF